MGIHKDTEILKLLHFLYAVQITLYWHTILFLMHQWLHVNLVRGVILKYTSKIAKKPLKSAHVNHQKKNKVYFICRCILFNINTKSLILIYKEIYKYVFLKIYRQAYFSTLLNMHLLLYIDTHTHSRRKPLCPPVACQPVRPVLFWERNGISVHLLLIHSASDTLYYCTPSAHTVSFSLSSV